MTVIGVAVLHCFEVVEDAFHVDVHMTQEEGVEGTTHDNTSA